MGMHAGGGLLAAYTVKGSGDGDFEKEVLNGGAGGVGHAVGGGDLS